MAEPCIESEAKLHMKDMIDKQMKYDDMSLASTLNTKKDFSKPFILHSELSTHKGLLTGDNYDRMLASEQRVEVLRAVGLNDDDIHFYLSIQCSDTNNRSKRRLENLEVTEERLQRIRDTIHDHKQSLDESNSEFSGKKSLGRHRMELEKLIRSLNPIGDKVLQNFVMSKVLPVNKLDSKRKASAEVAQSSKLCSSVNENLEIKPPEESHNQADTSHCFLDNKWEKIATTEERMKVVHEIHERSSPEYICNAYIKLHRLSAQEIQALPTFREYLAGVPSKILYLKNLHKTTTECNLRSLFDRFTSKDCGDRVTEYKLMKGRMRGQAFITFQDETKAAKALAAVNGFILHGQPIIISYGNKTN